MSGYQTRTIVAKDIQVGDELFSSNKNEAPCFWWHRVKAVRILPDHLEIDAGGFTTWKHPEEGVAVRRWEELP